MIAMACLRLVIFVLLLRFPLSKTGATGRGRVPEGPSRIGGAPSQRNLAVQRKLAVSCGRRPVV